MVVWILARVAVVVIHGSLRISAATVTARTIRFDASFFFETNVGSFSTLRGKDINVFNQETQMVT